MRALLEGVKDKLEGKVGTWKAATGWNISIGNFPTTPDTAVGVMLGPSLPANPKYLLDYPSVQILVRADTNGYAEGLDKITLAKDILLGIASQTVKGVRWVQVNMIGDINQLGRDDKARPMFSANFQFIIEPPTNADTNRIPL